MFDGQGKRFGSLGLKKKFELEGRDTEERGRALVV